MGARSTGQSCGSRLAALPWWSTSKSPSRAAPAPRAASTLSIRSSACVLRTSAAKVRESPTVSVAVLGDSTTLPTTAAGGLASVMPPPPQEAPKPRRSATNRRGHAEVLRGEELRERDIHVRRRWETHVRLVAERASAAQTDEQPPFGSLIQSFFREPRRPRQVRLRGAHLADRIAGSSTRSRTMARTSP